MRGNSATLGLIRFRKQNIVQWKLTFFWSQVIINILTFFFTKISDNVQFSTFLRYVKINIRSPLWLIEKSETWNVNWTI